MQEKAEKSGKKPLLVLLAFLTAVIAAGLLTAVWLEHPNDKAAKATLWKICEVQNEYYKRHGIYGTLESLRADKLTTIKLQGEINLPWGSVQVDEIQGAKNGYFFIFFIRGDKWKAYALPGVPGKTGYRKFYINQSGKWRSARCMSEEDIDADFRKSKFPGW
jgi:predicted outer membrane lipoprotein